MSRAIARWNAGMPSRKGSVNFMPNAGGINWSYSSTTHWTKVTIRVVKRLNGLPDWADIYIEKPDEIDKLIAYWNLVEPWRSYSVVSEDNTSHVFLCEGEE